jgi:hypothetical protein
MLFPDELAGEERAILARVLGGERLQHYETQRVRVVTALLTVVGEG